MSNFLTGVRNHPYSTSQLKVRPYFAFALMKKRSVKCKVFSFWLLFVWLASELSSNQSLASILIPAHARNQAGASTPTNASATSGPPLFQTTFVLIWHPLCFGYSVHITRFSVQGVCVVAVTVLTDQKLEHLFYQLCFYSMMYKIYTVKKNSNHLQVLDTFLLLVLYCFDQLLYHFQEMSI